MAEMLRKGKPQMLFAIIATWIVKVARARPRAHVCQFLDGQLLLSGGRAEDFRDQIKHGFNGRPTTVQ